MPDYEKPQLKTKSFNVLFTPDLQAQLDHLAHVSGESRGAVIRKLIAHAFAMRFQAHPICASGRPCLVPHLHVSSAQPLPGGLIG